MSFPDSMLVLANPCRRRRRRYSTVDAHLKRMSLGVGDFTYDQTEMTVKDGGRRGSRVLTVDLASRLTCSNLGAGWWRFGRVGRPAEWPWGCSEVKSEAAIPCLPALPC